MLYLYPLHVLLEELSYILLPALAQALCESPREQHCSSKVCIESSCCYHCLSHMHEVKWFLWGSTNMYVSTPPTSTCNIVAKLRRNTERNVWPLPSDSKLQHSVHYHYMSESLLPNSIGISAWVFAVVSFIMRSFYLIPSTSSEHGTLRWVASLLFVHFFCGVIVA